MSRNVGLPPEDVSDLSVAVKILCDIRLVVAGFCFVLVGLDNLPDWLSWVLVAQLAVSLVLLLKWHEWGGRIVTGWLWPIGETACLLVVFVDSHYWWATSMLMTTTVVFLACAGTWRTVFMAGLGLVAMTGAALAGLVPTVGWVDSSASGLNSYMMVIGMAASLVACEVMGWYLRFLMLRQGRLLRERAETGALEAAEWERVRTAEELHDGLGKTLSGSAMKIGRASC
ncbi:MAG: hypothetical protein LBR32_00875, partial [Propionibacteriaceae bacterium]|nr:hypothetical protein [Propionibacteriaceae bacterium]